MDNNSSTDSGVYANSTKPRKPMAVFVRASVPAIKFPSTEKIVEQLSSLGVSLVSSEGFKSDKYSGLPIPPEAILLRIQRRARAAMAVFA